MPWHEPVNRLRHRVTALWVALVLVVAVGFYVEHRDFHRSCVASRHAVQHLVHDLVPPNDHRPEVVNALKVTDRDLSPEGCP